MNPRVRVHVDRDRLLGSRDPLMFGHFIEHFHRQIYGGIYDPGSPLADEQGFRTDVIEAIRRLKPSVIRWPGGCFVSAYHWQDGVGPRRQPAYDKAWRVEESNNFGTDEFIAFCRATGAEPYICTNAGTAPPEEAADWLEYCNLSAQGRWARLRAANGYPEPHRVRYWSVGNENYGHWELGAKEADEWSRYVAETAKMMRRVDGSIVLSAASTADLDWNLRLLQRAGRYLDLISIHAYLARQTTAYPACMAQARLIEEHITRMEHILAATDMAGRVRIAFDEWNPRFWHHPSFLDADPRLDERDLNDENATYTMADAVLHACFLNAALRHCRSVAMTNFSPLVNARGAIYTHAGGLILRPTYHVCELYANHTLAEVLDAHCAAPTFEARSEDGTAAAVPYCDVAATMDRSAQRIAVAIANLHPDDVVTCTVWLPGTTLRDRAATLYTVGGPAVASFNDLGHPDDVRAESREVAASGDSCVLDLPPHSASVLMLDYR